MLIKLILLLFFSLSASYSSARSDLPQISLNSFNSQPSDEKRLGDLWLRKLKGSAPLTEDIELEVYLEELVNQIVQVSDLSDMPLSVVVINSPELNAFAAPGGIIGINSGVLLHTQNEAELSSIFAHEIAHLSQRHYAAQLEQQQKNQAWLLTSLLGGILIGAADPRAGQAAISSAMAAQQQSALAFSRQHEQEADRLGMQTLARAGYNPNAMPDMFSRLQYASRYNKTPPEFLLTHPVTSSRIADAMNRAATLPTLPTEVKNPLFYYVKARTEALFSSNKGEHLNTLLQLKQPDSLVTDYAISYTSLLKGNLDLAQQMIDKLLKKHPEESTFLHLKTEILINKAELSSAVQLSINALKLRPTDRIQQMLLAKAYQLQGNINETISIYRELLNQRPEDTQLWYQIAEAYGLSQNISATHRSRIEYFLKTGDTQNALRQIEFARHDKERSLSDTARLDAYEEEAKQMEREYKELM